MSLPPHLRLLLRAKWFWLLLGIMVLGAQFAASSTAHHVSKRDFKREIDGLEEQWRTALLTSDVAAMNRLLSDDFIGISMTGEANTKMEQLERVRRRMLILKRIDLSDRKVKLVGPVAIVTSRAEVEGVRNGESMMGIFRYTRIYQRLPSGIWKTTNFEATRVPRSGYQHSRHN